MGLGVKTQKTECLYAKTLGDTTVLNNSLTP